MRFTSPCSPTSRSRPIRSAWLVGAILAAPVAGLAACAHVPPAGQGSRPGATLRSFRDAAELQAYHVELVEAILSKPPLGSAQVPPPALPPPRPPGDTTTPPEPEPEPVDARIHGDPIIRAHADYLLVLREGRLHTIRVAGGALEPVAAVDALGAGVSRENALFADLFVSGDTAWVRASRSAGKTAAHHVVLFRVGRGGGLEHLDADVLNGPLGLHAGGVALLRGGKLVLYDDVEVPVEDRDVFAALPSLPRPDGGRVTTAAPERIYRSVHPMGWSPGPELHVVTVCGWKAAALDCASTAAYAPRPNVVHVSANAVYLRTDQGEAGVMYRIPLDGSAPSALRISGSTYSPNDFLESADGYLNVHLLHGGWTEESRYQLPTPTLLRVPLSAFGDGRRAPDPRHYRALQRLGGFYYSHFAGGWMVYGNRPYGDYMAESGLIPATERERLGIGMLRWADTTAATWVPTRTSTQAFAPAGDGAVLALLGGGDSLALALLPLGGTARQSAMAAPTLEHWQGVMRGIVPHPGNTVQSGLLAVITGVRPTRYQWQSTGVVFIRYDSAGMRRIGEVSIGSEPGGEREVVPVFAHGRTFVLLGGEVVEVAVEGDGIREIRRIPLP